MNNSTVSRNRGPLYKGVYVKIAPRSTVRVYIPDMEAYFDNKKD